MDELLQVTVGPWEWTPRSKRKEGDLDMNIPSHPSAEELRQAIKAKGGMAVCKECGGEELSVEEVSPMDAAGAGYGTHRLNRADLICENCGHVMGYELDKLRTDE